MAGTRFLIQLSFLLQIIVLTLFTLYQSWNYNDITNEGIFPNRNGIWKLQQQMIFDITNNSLPLDPITQPSLIEFELNLPSSVYDKEELVDALKLSLSERISVEVEAYESSNLDNLDSTSICEVNSDEDLLLLIEKNEIFTHDKGISKIMLMECVLSNTDLSSSSNTNKEKQQSNPNTLQSIINVHESGGILIRIYKTEKHEAIPTSYLTKLLHNPTSDIITQMITLGNDIKKDEPDDVPTYLFKDALIKSTQIKLFITVIDEDPISYNNTHPYIHHKNVGNALSKSIQLYLQPFLNKISPLINISIISKTSIHMPDYDDDGDDNTYSTISQKSIESLFHDKSYMQSKYLDSLLPSDYSMDYFILLPSLDNMPLYISTIDSKKNKLNDNKDALRYQNGNIFSICNLPLPSPSSSSCQDCSITSILLQNQLQKIMLLFISQLRSQLLGLSRQKEIKLSNHHANNNNAQHTTTTISYLPVKNGIAYYEIGSLLRSSSSSILNSKYDYVVKNLQILNNLISIRRNIPMSVEIGTKFQDAISTLHSIKSYHSFKSLSFSERTEANNNTTTTTTNGTLEKLNHILYIFIWIKYHPSIIELNHFPRDYWLAVFAPLLFPLIIPLFIGLIKEWKRLQRLNAKKTIK